MSSTPESDSSSPGYHAFISYTQRGDQALASALQRELRRFGVPFYLHEPAFPPAPRGKRRRPLRIFRDATHVPATSSLPNDLARAIEASSWLILFASPDAASSHWVRQEVRLWLAKDPTASRVLIAWTDGKLAISDDHRRLCPVQTDALPAELVAALQRVPRWIDLRGARAAIASGKGRLGDIVGDFAAPIQGVDKDSLIGEHLRQQSRTLRTALTAAGVLAALAVVATVLAVFAYRAQAEAIRQRNVAIANSLVDEASAVADAQPGLARQLLAAAGGLSLTPTVAGALVTGRAIPQEARTDAEFATFSPDGTLLAVARSGHEEHTIMGRKEPANDGFIKLLDAASLAEVGMIPLGRCLSTGMAFVPGPRRRIAIGCLRKVSLWDVTDPKRPKALPDLPEHGDVVDLMAFARDGRAATIDWRHDLRLWNLDGAEPKLLGSLALPELAELSYNRLAFSVDGKHLVLSEVTRGPTFIDVSDPSRPTVVPRTEGLSSVQNFAYAPEGGWAVSGGRETTVVRWRVRTDGAVEAPVTLPGVSATVTEVSTGVGGQIAAITEAGSVLLWRGGLGADPPVLVNTLRIPRFDASNADAFEFSPVGRRLLLLSPGGNAGKNRRPEMHTLRVWNLADAHRLGAPFGLVGGSFAVQGHRLAVGTEAGIELWDLTQAGSPALLSSLVLPLDGSEELAFNGSGTRLAAWSLDELLVIDTRDPVHPSLLGSWKFGPIFTAGFTDDVTVAIASSAQIGLFDTTRPDRTEPVARITGHYGTVTDLRMLRSPGGVASMVVGSLASQVVDHWDVSDVTKVRALGGDCGSGRMSHEPGGSYCRGGDHVLDLATDPTGKLLASANRDGSVRLWAVEDGAALRELATVEDTGDLYGAALSPSGRRLATIGRDETLRFYRVGAESVVLEGLVHIGAGSGSRIAFSDDHTLLAGTRDGLIDFWELDPATNISAVCIGSGEPMSPAQWARDVPGIEFSPPCGAVTRP